MPKSISRAIARSVSACALVCSAALLISNPTYADERKVDFNIPGENTAKALNDFSSQSGIQILFPYETAAETTATPVKGNYSTHDALMQLLANSNLEIESQTGNVVILRAAKSDAPAAVAEQPTEVIVIGSHIRGGNPTSPIHALSRTDIEQSGYSQTGDLVRSLPENFSGGQNPGVVSGAPSFVNPNNNNVTNASTINLRGLGSDATLVLLNGHRLPSDSAFQSSDISGIPLSAVQRVEVLPDGASALYGADAVGGVVNFVLRKNYTGTEVSARVATSTQGGGTERTFSLLTGAASNKANILFNAEATNQDAITWADRDIVGIGSPENMLVQPQKRQSAFVSAGWKPFENVNITMDALVSNREATRIAKTSAAAPQVFTTVTTPAYSLALSVEVGLAKDWKLDLTALSGGSRNSTFVAIPAYSLTQGALMRNHLEDVEATAGGTAFSLPTGPVRVALGGGRRSETFVSSAEYSRSVDYLYFETLVPLVEPSTERAGLQELTLSVAGRAEKYSDFGSSTNPKVGLRYVPIDGVAIRGSWGKSFKAPTFLQLHNRAQLYLFDASYVGGPDTGTVLDIEGGNPDLEPEKATSWTLGADFTPSRDLKWSVTYFSVDYEGRIVQPVNPFTGALSDPRFSPFVELSPSDATKADLFARSTEFNNFASTDYDPADVVAAIYNQNTNATAQTIKGVDLSYRQAFRLDFGDIDTFANASWLTLKQQTIPTLPSIELSGTIFSPPKFKARGGASWRRGGFSATAVVNYIADEADTLVTPNFKVDPWTTVDATVAYRFGEGANAFSDLRIVLSASNLFDKAPPYTPSPISNMGPHFDSTNASIIGRFVSITVSKAW